MFHVTQFPKETILVFNMEQKKRAPNTRADYHAVQFREKRKWQIALRRYIIEHNKSSFYAPFFGLGIEKFREWIEQQFDEETNWENFSQAWQLDHIVPVSYFDFSNEEEMKMCWNFINIRIEKMGLNKDFNTHIDVLTAKHYFETLFKQTGYIVCEKMIRKIGQIETLQLASNQKLEAFIEKNKSYLDVLANFTSYEYDKLNTGTPLENVLFEMNFLKRFEK